MSEHDKLLSSPELEPDNSKLDEFPELESDELVSYPEESPCEVELSSKSEFTEESSESTELLSVLDESVFESFRLVSSDVDSESESLM